MSTPPHICFLNRVYPPAPGATGALLAELAAALVERGWRVTVCTGPVRGAPASARTDAGVHVERVSALSFTRANAWRRGLAYASLFPGFLARVLRIPSPDVLVTKTDPPLLKVLGPLLGAWTGARTVHWAQDLYPEVTEAMSVLTPDGLLARTLRSVSTWALRRHDRVVTVGRCMRERIVDDRDVSPERVSVIPNWPPETVHPIAHEENAFRTEHGLEDRFVVMYSGNMGLAHPFDVVLDAAARLDADDSDVCVLFVGDGPRKAELKAQVADRGLSNVQFLPFQSRDRLAQSLSAADVHLVTMQAGLSGLVVPSKLYGALAAGRPVLFVGPDDSEAARVITEHECGSVLSLPSGSQLAEALRDWQAHPDRCMDAGQRAREAVSAARSSTIERFDTLLREVLEGEGPPTDADRL